MFSRFGDRLTQGPCMSHSVTSVLHVLRESVYLLG